MEYELLDTGIFDDGRYFDVEVEYAKAGPEDLLCRITVHNRGAEAAPIHVLPTLWFRNTWSWAPDDPSRRSRRVDGAHPVVRAEHARARRRSTSTPSPAPSCCSARTRRTPPACGAAETRPRYPKDGIDDHVVARRRDTVNPAGEGTKAAAHVRLVVPAGGRRRIACG